MLYLSTKIHNQPLFSIRTTGRIGTVIEPIINPHNLHIDAFYCDIFNANSEQILLDMYVRDIGARGFIIDDHESLSNRDELVRLQPVLDMNFTLINKQALVNKKKVGKVVDYTIDSESLFIQKFYVQQPVWQNINQSNLVFDRLSIVEVTDGYIMFSGPEEKSLIPNPLQVTKKDLDLSADYSANASEISE